MIKVAIFGLLIISLASAAQSISFTTHYIRVGPQDASVAIAADQSGDIFVVSALAGSSSGAGIRITKTDPRGNIVATMDLGQGVRPAAATVDPQGNLIVVGNSGSLAANVVVYNSFIAKIDNGLNGIIGMANTLQAQPAAVTTDSSGNVYVAGSSGTGFPTTPGSYQPNPPSGADYGFVAVFSNDLSSILRATLFGGAAADCQYSAVCGNPVGGANLPAAGTTIAGILLDSSGSVVIAGSSDGVPAPVGNVSYSYGFVAKFSPDLSSLEGEETFSNAVNFDTIFQAVAVDSHGDVVVVGATMNGGDFPAGSLQSKYPGKGFAGIVMKFDGNLQNRIWQTFFGGVSLEQEGVQGVAIDSQDNIWITGVSTQNLLPYSTSSSILSLPFVAELTPDGSAILDLVSSQFGGAAVAMLPNGPAVMGATDSFLLPGAANQPPLLMVANSANDMSSGTIAPAEVISLYGPGIGPQTPLIGQITPNGSFGLFLGGYQVSFSGFPAPILYAGPNQINVVASSEIEQLDSVAITVIGPSGRTTFPTVFVGTARPQIFSRQVPYSFPPGNTPIAQTDAVANNQDGSLNTMDNPAAAGSVATIWATGTGLPVEAVPDGSILTTAETTNLPITLTWNGEPLDVIYAGQAPGQVVGLMQINFRVPSNVIGLPYAPFYVRFQLDGVTTNSALVQVAAN